MTMAEYYNRQIPEYYPTMYMNDVKKMLKSYFQVERKEYKNGLF